MLVRAYADNAIDGTHISGPYAAVSFVIGGRARIQQSAASTARRAVPCNGRLNGVNVVHAVERGTIVGKSPLFCWKPADMDHDGRRA